MNNKAAISHAAGLARSANWLSMYHIWTGYPERATYWLDRRTQHMATARRLKQDATV